MSLVQYLKILNRASHAGNTAYFSVPTSKKDIRQFKRMLKVADLGRFIATVLDSTEQTTRINGGVPDWGNIKASEENKKLYQFISENNLDQYFNINVTGTAQRSEERRVGKECRCRRWTYK